MGLTNTSTGSGAKDNVLDIEKKEKTDVIVALAGNPNVGKSTLFNALTGMKQHTGNWPGKTVSNARGERIYKGRRYIFVDIPGSYSLLPHSAEEEVAGDFICSGNADISAVVCAASCLERNLNLVLQIMEVSKKTVVCINLMDEAEDKGIEVDCRALSEKLGVPVVPMCARNKSGIDEFLEALKNSIENGSTDETYSVDYGDIINKALSLTEKKGRDAVKVIETWNEKEPAIRLLMDMGIEKKNAEDSIALALSKSATDIAKTAVRYKNSASDKRDRRLDRIFSSKIIGFPLMILMLGVVFWLTISGANIPSQLLNNLLFGFEDNIYDFLINTPIPTFIVEMLVFGMYRVVAWVVSVMLPPMAVFFPLFTILEDSGYLPRVAFNLDKCFKKCRACGKQALTMCMGFGCNAAGVTGCRIIDSKRERLVAILTNSFVPCNGRFPMMIAVITMFFTGYASGSGQSLISAVILCGVIVFGIVMTFVTSSILTKTVLKGEPSSFILEMPPYRRPKIGEVVVRSVFDRTIFVLGRAISAAAPAGIIIWLMANVTAGGETLLAISSEFLDPLGKLMGLDGIILMAFVLGFPANEIVVPVMIMAYMNNGVLTDMTELGALKELLISNGWTVKTAVCMLLFALMHWPCSTTILTVKKETEEIKWTLMAFALPTVMGIIICMAVNMIFGLFI